MLNTIITQTKDKDEFASKIVENILNLIKIKNKKNEPFTLAVSGGSTPIPVFKLLSKKKNTKINWSNVHVFSLDERCVPKDDPRNNYFSCYSNWLKNFPEIKSYRIETWINHSAATINYNRLINKILLKNKGIPQFDLIFMGIGNDGHFASLFPEYDFSNTPSLYVENLYVKKIKEKRITLTLPIINNASNRIIGVYGEEKRKVFSKCFKSRINAMNVPIHYLKDSFSNDIWILK